MKDYERHRPRFELVLGERSEDTMPRSQTNQWPLMGHCAKPETAHWFRVVDTNNESAVEAAKLVCDVCIVKQTCLDFGLALPEHVDFAIWGGTTPEERVEIRSNRGDQELPKGS